MIDLHAHEAQSEVIGLLAGEWVPSIHRLVVHPAFPCNTVTDREISTKSADAQKSPESRNYHRRVEMRGFRVVCWYYSHLDTLAEPSGVDVESQGSYQGHFKEGSDEAFVGVTVGRYRGHLPSSISDKTWFLIFHPILHSPKPNKKQHPEDNDLPTIKDMDSAELQELWVNRLFQKITLPGSHALDLATGRIITDGMSVSIHRRKAKIKDSPPHHPDYVPWDKARSALLIQRLVPIVEKGTSDLLGADRGKGDIRFTGSQVQDTCTTPKVNFRNSFAEYYQRANINSAKKWREWRLAEKLRVQRAQGSHPSLVTTDPQQVDAGIRWFVQYIEAMLAHYTILNNHADWRWRVYWLKQREVERACKFIATLGGTMDDWRDSKTDLVIAWVNAPVNLFKRISGNSGPKRRIKARLALPVRLICETAEAYTSPGMRDGGAECGASPVAQACPPMSSLRIW
ncbi:hypothetical protein BJ742DRAFT_775860 [Cladochytrium replicatum]|nr:hypothetical protein BJ742DRAFT_775860 [Cladochytrium replicatum]